MTHNSGSVAVYLVKGGFSAAIPRLATGRRHPGGVRYLHDADGLPREVEAGVEQEGEDEGESPVPAQRRQQRAVLRADTGEQVAFWDLCVNRHFKGVCLPRLRTHTRSTHVTQLGNYSHAQNQTSGASLIDREPTWPPGSAAGRQLQDILRFYCGVFALRHLTAK